MNSPVRILLSLAGSLALTACGSIPTKTFEVRAKNFEGNDVPCLVVVDRDFREAVEAERYTDCDVEVGFEKSRMNLKVFPTRFDSEGKIVAPDPAAQGEYYTESRDLILEDPRMHLFLLRTNPDWTGN